MNKIYYKSQQQMIIRNWQTNS